MSIIIVTIIIILIIVLLLIIYSLINVLLFLGRLDLILLFLLLLLLCCLYCLILLCLNSQLLENIIVRLRYRFLRLFDSYRCLLTELCWLSGWLKGWLIRERNISSWHRHWRRSRRCRFRWNSFACLASKSLCLHLHLLLQPHLFSMLFKLLLIKCRRKINDIARRGLTVYSVIFH